MTSLTDTARLRSIADLPCPGGLPLIGNVLELDKLRFHTVMEDWSRQLGPLYRFRMLQRDFVVTANHDSIATLLRNRPDTFRRSGRTAEIMEEMGIRGVFSAEGDDWRMQRKLTMRALTPDVVHRFHSTLHALTERLRARWERMLAAGATIDVLRDLKAYTLDVTLALAMGQDVNTLEHDDNPLQRDIEFLFATIGRRLVTALPYWRVLPLGQDRAAVAAMDRVIAAARGFIAQARARLAQPGAAPANLLEAFIVAADEPGSGCTDEHVVGNAETMVYAGEDTTSNSAAWLLDFVARDARVAAAITAEADAALGADRVLPDHERFERFPYLEAANREAMRIKPVAAFMPNEAVVDTDLEGVRIPAGTIVIVLLRRSAELTMRLPDWDLFRPERWLDETAPGVNDPGRAMFPFGGGPRFCPGRYLAMAELKVVLSMLFRNFELELDPHAPPVEERFTFTVTPSALPVRLRRRAAA
jgi:cytochrome P450